MLVLTSQPEVLLLLLSLGNRPALHFVLSAAILCITGANCSVLKGIIRNRTRFCNHAFFQFPCMIHQNTDRPALQNPLLPNVVHFLVMLEIMHGKIFMNGFEERYLVC